MVGALKFCPYRYIDGLINFDRLMWFLNFHLSSNIDRYRNIWLGPIHLLLPERS